MKLLIGLTLAAFSAPVLAHDGPLLSMAHADFWVMCLIALAVLFGSVRTIISRRTKTVPAAPVYKQTSAFDLAIEPVAVAKSFGGARNV